MKYRHFTQYHSVSSSNRSLRDSPHSKGEFRISITKKKHAIAQQAIGNVVWLISGEDSEYRRGKDYRIEYWFIPTKIVKSRHPRYDFEVRGTKGEVFPDGLLLNNIPWFQSFYATGFYGLGLQPLQDEFAQHFSKLASAGGFRTPDDPIPPLIPADVESTPNKKTASPPQRVTTSVDRIIRDTAATIAVKRIYDFYCQACTRRIETPKGPYAEGAHIRPLGADHGGADSIDNVLCLCPICHVLLDYGAITITDYYHLKGQTAKMLRVSPKHPINVENLAYHRKNVFVRPKTQ